MKTEHYSFVLDWCDLYRFFGWLVTFIISCGPPKIFLGWIPGTTGIFQQLKEQLAALQIYSMFLGIILNFYKVVLKVMQILTHLGGPLLENSQL